MTFHPPWEVPLIRPTVPLLKTGNCPLLSGAMPLTVWSYLFLDLTSCLMPVTEPVTFGIKSAGSPSTVLVTVTNGKCHLSTAADNKDAAFTLSALPEQWSEFFKLTPQMP